MLKDEEVKALIAKELLEEPEVIELLQRYIFDHKGVEVKIDPCTNLAHVMLMNHFHSIASLYYLEKWR